MNAAVGALAPPKLYVHLRPTHSARLIDVMTATERDQLRAKWLIEFGAVYVDQFRVIDPERLVTPDNVIRIHLKPKRYAVDRQDLLKRVVYESDDFMIVNKPSGLPMHATLDNLYENLVSSFGQTLHVTHRLDVPTSGLVLVAKTKEYQSLFNRIISERAIRKTYQASSLSPVNLGAHDHFMRKTVRAPKEVFQALPQGEDPGGFEICQLVVENCEPSGRYFISTVKLITGRTHQIRAQFSFLGASLIGDEMYGGEAGSEFGLHASQIAFECPKTSKLLEFSCPLTRTSSEG